MIDRFFEQVAADKSQIGFDYQDLVCLEYLIDIKPGETVGLEVFDDVHHVRINGSKDLIQVKHSISDGSTLTNRDIDLWKTLYNWELALEAVGSDEIDKFIFFTNKKKTSKEGIINFMDLENIDILAISNAIKEIKCDLDSKLIDKSIGATVNPIKKYVDHICSLNHSQKNELFSRVSLIFSTDDIFSRLAKKLQFFSISEDQSFDVLRELIGVFKEMKYKLIKSNTKVLINYDLFRTEFQFDRIIKMSQDRKIDFSRYYQFKNINSIDPKTGLFAKQLSDISVSEEDITMYAIEYATTNMFIQKLIIAGDFSESENGAINEEVFYGWKSLYDDLYDRDEIEIDSEHCRLARSCVRKLGLIPLVVSNSTLPKAMVIGKGIELSDMCRIGWRKDWKSLYGKNE